MQAMDAAVADLYEEDGKDLAGYDFEPLPTLPEDEVSPGAVGPASPHLLLGRVRGRVPRLPGPLPLAQVLEAALSNAPSALTFSL